MYPVEHATRVGLESRVPSEYPLSNQKVTVRQPHKVVGD